MRSDRAKRREKHEKAYMVAALGRFFPRQMAVGLLGKGPPGNGFPMVTAGFPRGVERFRNPRRVAPTAATNKRWRPTWGGKAEV